MYRAKESLNIIAEGERFALVKGEVVELTPGQAHLLVGLGYVEEAKGAPAPVETPEAKAAEGKETRKK